MAFGRLRAAVHAARKAFTVIWDSPRSRLYLPRTRFDFAREVGDGLTSSIVVAGLMWIARTFPEAPVAVMVNGELDTEHLMALHLRRPNPYYSGSVLWMGTMLSLNTDGNAYWLKVRNGRAGGRGVVETYYCPHWQLEPKWPDGGREFITHYEYTAMGQKRRVEIEDVVHLRYGIDPQNPRKGFGLLKPLFREVFTDDEAANFSAALLRNMGVPGVIVGPPDSAQGPFVPRSPEDKAAVEAEWKSRFGGDRRGQPLFADAPFKVEQVGFDPERLDLSRLRGIPEERWSATLGVPAAVIGFGSGLAQTKVGAPQPLSARLWTPEGPTTMGQVRPGSVVAIPGAWGTVNHVYPQGEQQIYRITFQDGSTAESTIDHLWDVSTPNLGREVVPLSAIAQWPAWKRKRASVPLQGVTEFAERPLAIPPYVLGLLLADGTFRGNLQFSSVDSEIVSTVREMVGAGYSVKKTALTGCDYRIKYDNHRQGKGIGGGSGNINPFINELRRIGLWMVGSPDKFIPDDYKYNSSRVRRQLLQGLLDGDGYVNLHGQPALEQTSARLADDVTDIVQSLGGYTLRSRKAANRNVRLIKGHPMRSRHDRIHLSIVIDDAASLFCCSVKRERCRPRTKAPTRKIRSIEFVRAEQAQCIEVDGGLYLTDNFIVTHNTMRELREMAYEGCIIPLQRLVSADLDVQLLPDFEPSPERARTVFDLRGVRVLQEDQTDLVRRLDIRVRGGWLTVAKAKIALGEEPAPGDEVYLRSFGALPIPEGASAEEQMAGTGRVPAEPTPGGNGKLRPWGREEKALSTGQRSLVLRFLRSRRRLEASFSRDLERHFDDLGERAEQLILRMAHARGLHALDVPALKENPLAGFDWSHFMDELAPEMLDYDPQYLSVVDAVLGDLQATMGIMVNLSSPLERRVLSAGGLRKGLVDLEKQTRDALFQTLGELREEEGLGVEAIARRIRDGISAGPWSTSQIRATVIARTETAYAQSVGALAAYRESEDVTGVQVVDAQLGPTDEECLPAGTEIVAMFPQVAFRRWFEGDLVAIVTKNGHFLSATSNHPVLTRDGWVRAADLQEGDQVLSCEEPKKLATLTSRESNPDHDDVPSAGEKGLDLANIPFAAGTKGETLRAGHLDRDRIDREINAVPTECLPGNGDLAERLEPAPQFTFIGTIEQAGTFAAECAGDQGSFAPSGATRSIIRGAGPGLALLGAQSGIGEQSRLGAGSQSVAIADETSSCQSDRNPELPSDLLDCGARSIDFPGQTSGEQGGSVAVWGPQLHATLPENLENRRPADMKHGRELVRALSGLVLFDQIVGIKRESFHGFVYNLQTRDGWYVANGIITHNCEDLNGQIVSIDEADRLAESEHPNGTRMFVPVVAAPVASE